VTVTVQAADWDDPDAEALRAAQRVELDTMYGADVEPGAKPSAADISYFVLARDASGVAVGCGALRRLDEHAAEIKRMFVPKPYRGRGISRAVLSALEEHARRFGWRVLRLETGPLQVEAIGLYTSAGYAPIPPFGPYVDSGFSLCFERPL
jgi:GNAT superfamily N-acetyltransferase